MSRPKRTDDPDDPAACYKVALRLLNLRWHARRELEKKLAVRGFGVDATAQTLDRLEREGWIDDDRFASEYVLARRRKAIPARRIGLELERLGVDVATARAAVDEGVDDDTEREKLLEIGRRKADSLAQRHGNAFLHEEVGRRKLSGALLRRGYDGSAVLDAVEQILNERPNEDEND